MKRNTIPTAKMTREEWLQLRRRGIGCFGHYGKESIQKHLAALGGEDWETASHR